jgi:RsiW-degrading membrane proteinase PrsW (M82 family)
MSAALPQILLGLAPACLMLAGLVVLDSYKLVRLRVVLQSLIAGAAAVLICSHVNRGLMVGLGLDADAFSRYVAPLTEEAAKAVYVIVLIAGRRIGFMVDAAILGFATGAGFGMIENVLYLRLLPDAGLSTWLLRGCGTALMHGTTGAVFGIVSRSLRERDSRVRIRHFLPGLALAVLLHSGFNHFFLTPVATALALVVGVPLVMAAVYQQSEASLERWLGRGFDADAELLEQIASGRLTDTPIGSYLRSLRDHFTPEIVTDMFCLLRLEVELAIQAKAILLMRREGYDPPLPPDARARLAEMRYLESSLGRTGRLALQPLRRRRHRDLWEKNLLQQA